MPDPTIVDIDPVALSLGPLKVHWYGIMYLLAFGAYWLLGAYRARQPDSGWTKDDVGDLLFYGALGVILGGRLGYMLFYDLSNVLADPSRIIRIWEGGMSFHGGLIGVIVAMAWYGRKTSRAFFQVADFVAPLVPVGLGFGRLGNFIGGELWGRCSDASWAMVFPRAPVPGPGDWQEAACQAAQQARHPSQLYQALLEGVVLFAVVWLYSRRPRPTMAVSGLFLIGYGAFRFAVEFFREPDSHLGFIAFDWLTMGQLLSTPLIALGALLMVLAYRRAESSAAVS